MIDIPALIAGIVVIVVTLVLVGWCIIAFLGPSGEDEDDGTV